MFGCSEQFRGSHPVYAASAVRRRGCENHQNKIQSKKDKNVFLIEMPKDKGSKKQNKEAAAPQEQSKDNSNKTGKDKGGKKKGK